MRIENERSKGNRSEGPLDRLRLIASRIKLGTDRVLEMLTPKGEEASRIFTDFLEGNNKRSGDLFESFFGRPSEQTNPPTKEQIEQPVIKHDPEPDHSGAIEVVPLTTLIGEIDTYVTRVSSFYKFPKRMIKTEMSETPRLAQSVMYEMKNALTPDEARFIGETSLVVYQVVKVTPPPIEDFIFEGRRLLRKERIDGSIADVIQDDIYERTEGDKNTIYILLMEKMARRPALAAFVAERMKRSVSLEEANLVGRAALATYMTMDFILSLPVK